MTTATRMTLEEFLARPDIDERRLELIDGEVYEKMAPTWGHGKLATLIGAELMAHGGAGVEPRAIIGATGSRGPSSPLPDVAFYRDGEPAPDDWMRTPPHVAVEIRSPGQSRPELRAKVELYLDFGVESVWLVDPQRLEVEVFEGGERRILAVGDTLTSTAVPGLELSLRELFARAGMVEEA